MNYLQQAGTYHSLNEYLKSMLGKINQYQFRTTSNFKCLFQGDGIFSPGGSLSNMYGMMLARHNAFPDIKVTRRSQTNLSRKDKLFVECCSPLTIFQRTGLSGAPTLVALTSEESHYSIVKVSQEKQLQDNSY